MLLIVFVVIGGGVLLVRFAKSLEPRHRIVFVVVVILALAYGVPKVIQTALRAFRAGAEISREGR